jgi:Glycosyl transferase family 2
VNVWLVSPAWRRYQVTRLVLEQRRHLASVLAARGITIQTVIVADDDNLDLAREYGCVALEMDNRQLAAKFNAGIRYACQKGGADWICHIGSDDWVSPRFFEPLITYQQKIDAGERRSRLWRTGDFGQNTLVTGTLMLLVDLNTGTARRVKCNGRYGIIPWLIPRHMLVASDFQPIPRDRARGMDGGLIRGLGTKPILHWHDPGVLCRVDWKSDTNLNTYRAITNSIGYGPEEQDPFALLTEEYPVELVDLARETYENLPREGYHRRVRNTR